MEAKGQYLFSSRRIIFALVDHVTILTIPHPFNLEETLRCWASYWDP